MISCDYAHIVCGWKLSLQTAKHKSVLKFIVVV